MHKKTNFVLGHKLIKVDGSCDAVGDGIRIVYYQVLSISVCLEGEVINGFFVCQINKIQPNPAKNSRTKPL